MKNFSIILILLMLTVAVSGCLNQESKVYTSDGVEKSQKTSEETPEETADDEEVGQGPEDSTIGEADEASEQLSEPDESVDQEESPEPVASENIVVEAPLPHATLTSPFEVRGQARVFEGTVLIRVKNQYGGVVIPEQVATAHATEAGEFGPFKITLSYQFHATKEGVIEVFNQSAKDGSEENIVVIPVKFE
ncbi:Gmad2 immunoglobulin-like domain-containing protein [Patescibacteria group bacterium]|nr:Gmad2 immunoglobulin-like domain-containing protein [Patescibacteria group bacterium]MBU4511899.1 Gmad2 immunoglobulin-like domain-containing protein [Patescibacteria group bacterium]MCG2692867.1 Gmad2 immunoglobulin-like domain-containing protein [Candidatus Parcubacteria bacterium]